MLRDKNDKRPDCFIFDIDGTLACNEHRQHYVRSKPKNWNAYNNGMAQDGLILPVYKILAIIQDSGIETVYSSGRQEDKREVTLDWFEEHYIDMRDVGASERLFMRKTGDHRDDTVVKKEMLEEIKKNWNPIAVFDDRKKVKRMWVEQGLFVFDVNQGDIEF